jgi:hypothetical protein
MHRSELDDFNAGDSVDEWIPKLARRECILVTCLSSSRRKLVNLSLVAHGVRAVYFGDSFATLPSLVQASRLMSWWERIVKASYRLKRGENIQVGASGPVG